MRTPTNPRSLAIRSGGALSAVAAGLVLLAACGSGGGTSATSSTGSSSGTTVAVSHAGGMSMLTTSSGRTLYTSDQEKGHVLCTSGACNAIWTPLTVSAGQQPTAPGSVTQDLSTVKRPDGTRQVAFEGRPLYTFSFDHGAGQDNGNGVSDSFDGTSFTWHAVTPTGSAQASGSGNGSGNSSDNGSGTSHGYSYGY